MHNRRKFLQDTSLLMGGSLLASLDSNAFAIFNNNISPNDQVGVAAIGVNGGNIAFRSGEKIMWDKAAGRFTNKAVNEKYLMSKYHNGYQLPKI